MSSATHTPKTEEKEVISLDVKELSSEAVGTGRVSPRGILNTSVGILKDAYWNSRFPDPT